MVMTGGQTMKKARNAYISVNENLCKGCEICISVCPTDTLSIADHPNPKGYFPATQHAPEACIACNKCATMCPEVAIEVFTD